MSNTDVQELLAEEPPAVQAEIIDINTDARPIALQIALLVPLLAGLIGIGTAYRMTRLVDPEPSEAAENHARRLRPPWPAHGDRLQVVAQRRHRLNADGGGGQDVSWGCCGTAIGQPGRGAPVPGPMARTSRSRPSLEIVSAEAVRRQA